MAEALTTASQIFRATAKTTTKKRQTTAPKKITDLMWVYATHVGVRNYSKRKLLLLTHLKEQEVLGSGKLGFVCSVSSDK